MDKKLNIENVGYVTFHESGGLSTNDGKSSDIYLRTTSFLEFDNPPCELEDYEAVGKKILSKDGHIEDNGVRDWEYHPW